MLERYLKLKEKLESQLSEAHDDWLDVSNPHSGDYDNAIKNIERKLKQVNEKIAFFEAAKPPEEVHIEIFVLTALKAQILENLDEELANILPQERNGETLYEDWQPYLAESKNIEELFLDFKTKQGYNFSTTVLSLKFLNY